MNIRKMLAEYIGIDENDTCSIAYRPCLDGRLIEDHKLPELVDMVEETADRLQGYGLDKGTSYIAAFELITKHIFSKRNEHDHQRCPHCEV